MITSYSRKRQSLRDGTAAGLMTSTSNSALRRMAARCVLIYSLVPIRASRNAISCSFPFQEFIVRKTTTDVSQYVAMLLFHLLNHGTLHIVIVQDITIVGLPRQED